MSRPPIIANVLVVGPTTRQVETGRKPLADGEGSVITSIRLTPNQREKLSSLGGGKWVRLQIDSA